MPRKEEPDVRRYLVLQAQDELIIEVPSTWKLTFGYVNPGKSSDGYSRGEGHCLRIWEGEKLRAVYGNVRGFRDMSIPLARKVKRETGSASWVSDSEGNFERQEKREVETTLLIEAFDDSDDTPV